MKKKTARGSGTRDARRGFHNVPVARLREQAVSDRSPAGIASPVVPPSRDAIRAAIAAQTCPFCGRGPYKMLPVHTNKAHGVDKWELRDLAGLTSKEPLCSPEVLSALSEAAVRSGTHVAATAALKQKGRGSGRWTAAGRAKNTATIKAWMEENPEAAQAAAELAAASVTPEVRERQAESLRAWHAANPMSPEDVQRKVSALHTPEARVRQREVLAAMRQGCGTVASYKRGCRCDDCRQAKRDSRR